MNDEKTDNLYVREEGFCIGIHNFPLTKPLSSDSERSDSETVYRLLCLIMCLASSYAALPLCYVLNISLLFDIFDIVCDGITREAFRHTKQRCSGALFLSLGSSFVVEMKRTGK